MIAFPDCLAASLQCGCMTAFRRRRIITSSLTCECSSFPYKCLLVAVYAFPNRHTPYIFVLFRVTGGELFEDIVAREYYSEADAR